MRSWADHCSSDEDTDDNDEEQEQDQEQTFDAAFSEKAQIDDEEGPNSGTGAGANSEGGPGQQQQQQQTRTYDFPEHPPFTAFVGNLSFDIQETSKLQQGLADVVFDRLGERVNVLGGRISYDRDGNNKQHRGFGYVELETLDQVRNVS